MAVPISNAIAAYANAGSIGAAGTAPRPDATGAGFGDMLAQAAGDLTQTLHQGEAASLQAATGKADLNQVVMAVNNAEVTLQAVIAVRDRIIQAYQDISKLAI
jgi:flagellar hook-basal body complex protein FliE